MIELNASCLIFLYNSSSVGVGTVAAVFLAGTVPGLFNKAFGTKRDRLYGYTE